MCGEQEFYKAVSLHGAESAFLSCAQMTAWGKHLAVIIRGWKKKAICRNVFSKQRVKAPTAVEVIYEVVAAGYVASC